MTALPPSARSGRRNPATKGELSSDTSASDEGGRADFDDVDAFVTTSSQEVPLQLRDDGPDSGSRPDSRVGSRPDSRPGSRVDD